MTFLDKVKGWLMEIVEVGLILIALGIVLQILLDNANGSAVSMSNRMTMPQQNGRGFS